MTVFKHIFIITALTISCNASGMFGFKKELRCYPDELKAMYKEEETIRQNGETRQQTAARHEAELREANPEGWNRYQKGGWYNEEEIEQKQEQARAAQLEAMLAHIPLQSPVSKQTAQDFAISNQNFEKARTRRLSTEEQPANNTSECPRDRLIKIKLNKTTAL